MNWKEHLLLGFLFSIFFLMLMNYKFGWYKINIALLMTIIIICISTLVPDIDHENSILHQILLGFGLVFATIGVIGFSFFKDFFNWKPFVIYGVISSLFVFFIAQFASHRGFTHSIIFCLLYSSIIYLVIGFNLQNGIIAFVGCYTHLLLDKKPFKVI